MNELEDFYCYIPRKNVDKIGWIRPAIKGWNKCILKYIEFHKNECGETGFYDTPVYYNERAYISLLAAGAYLNGLVALEEYVTEKGRGKNRRHGRADLYIADKSNSLCIEFKKSYITPNSSEKKMKNIIEEAVNDAKLNTNEYQTAGGVFFEPHIPRRRSFDRATTDVLDIISGFKKICSDIDLFAYSFPKEVRNYTYKKRTRPGMILAIQLTRK